MIFLYFYIFVMSTSLQEFTTGLKGTVSGISSDPPGKDCNVLFTRVPFESFV